MNTIKGTDPRTGSDNITRQSEDVKFTRRDEDVKLIRQSEDVKFTRRDEDVKFTPPNPKMSSNIDQIIGSTITTSDTQIDDSSEWNLVVNKAKVKKEEKRAKEQAAAEAKALTKAEARAVKKKSPSEHVAEPVQVTLDPVDSGAIKYVAPSNLQGAWKVRAEKREAETVSTVTSINDLPKKQVEPEVTVVSRVKDDDLPQKVVVSEAPEVSIVSRVKRNGYVKTQPAEVSKPKQQVESKRVPEKSQKIQNNAKVSKPKQSDESKQEPVKIQNSAKVSKPKQSTESEQVKAENSQQRPLKMMGPDPRNIGPLPPLVLSQQHPQQMMGFPPQMMGFPPQMMGYPPQMMGFPPQMMGYPPQMMGFPSQMMGFPPQMMGFPTMGFSRFPPPPMPLSEDMRPPPLVRQTNALPMKTEQNDNQHDELIADGPFTRLIDDQSGDVSGEAIKVEPKQKVPVVREPNAKGCVPCSFKKCSKRSCGFVHSGQMCIHNHRVCDGEICEAYAKLCSEKVEKST